MKKSLLLLSLWVCSASFSAFAQWTNHTLNFQSMTRQYRVYVSPAYNASNPASLVFALHGLGDNMQNFSNIGMNFIADTANIIVVVPQAVTDPLLNANAWNSRAGTMGYYPNATVDDVGFISTLIDLMLDNYSINPKRIYCCGFSMGGFMTQRLACELNDKIAAFASVAGTLGSGITSCTPGRAVPIAHFHGTQDGTVGFSTNNYGLNADSLVNFWAAHNQCDAPPVHTLLPDVAADGFTVEHYLHENGQDQTEVEFFIVNNAGHIWLSPANDISYTHEIWKFFSKHQHPTYTSIGAEQAFSEVEIFPNPAGEFIQVRLGSIPASGVTLQLFDTYGRLVLSRQVQHSEYILPLAASGVAKGMYLLHLQSEKARGTFKIIVQ